MAPNPNECVNLLQACSEEKAFHSKQRVQVKIVTTSSEESSEDGEQFYDASSEIHSDDEDDHNTKDSGVEADKEQDFVIPDQHLSAKIVEQVEYYFSDAHILKDAFLLKHARRNREGYISLKLITSFKKVKHVSKDWRAVAYACRRSEKLQVNEAGTKVRRVDPIPDLDETTPSRTVVAIGIPPHKASIESAAEMFASFGAIALIRILRPGNPVPPDVRQCANRNPDILTSVCAVIEFETADSARTAVRDFSNENWRASIRLVELATRRNKNSPSSSRPVTPSSSDPEQGNTNKRKKQRSNAKNKAISIVHAHETTTWSSSDAEDKSPYIRRKNFYSSSPLSQASTPSTSPLQRRHVTTNPNNARHLTSSPELTGCRQKSASCSEPSTPGSQSPWVQRRLAAVSTTNSGRSSPQVANNRLAVPANVIRLPLGPDGTRGFHSINKPRSCSAPEAPRMTTVSS